MFLDSSSLPNDEWEAFEDPNSKKLWYWNEKNQECKWELRDVWEAAGKLEAFLTMGVDARNGGRGMGSSRVRRWTKSNAQSSSMGFLGLLGGSRNGSPNLVEDPFRDDLTVHGDAASRGLAITPLDESPSASAAAGGLGLQPPRDAEPQGENANAGDSPSHDPTEPTASGGNATSSAPTSKEKSSKASSAISSAITESLVSSAVTESLENELGLSPTEKKKRLMARLGAGLAAPGGRRIPSCWRGFGWVFPRRTAAHFTGRS